MEISVKVTLVIDHDSNIEFDRNIYDEKVLMNLYKTIPHHNNINPDPDPTWIVGDLNIFPWEMRSHLQKLDWIKQLYTHSKDWIEETKNTIMTWVEPDEPIIKIKNIYIEHSSILSPQIFAIVNVESSAPESDSNNLKMKFEESVSGNAKHWQNAGDYGFSKVYFEYLV